MEATLVFPPNRWHFDSFDLHVSLFYVEFQGSFLDFAWAARAVMAVI